MNDDLISRAALLDSYDVCKVTEYDESGCGVTYMAVSVGAIKNAPAVDAVEVVRCKDCMDYQPEPMCDVMMCYGGMCGRYTNPDDFCSYGRRKDAEGDYVQE